MAKNPRTRNLKDFLTDTHIRLSQQDRVFLSDLARVQFISDDLANQYHYQHRATAPAVRLDKLVDAGLLKKHTMHEYGRGQLKVYEFANDQIAKRFGSKRSAFGANRTLQHELVTSRLYFSLNRPADFRKENLFTPADKKYIHTQVGGHSDYKPDAIYSSGGEVVFVEADSGQYSKSQCIKKQVAWKNIKQVWGQPRNAAAPMQSGGSIQVFQY